MTNTLSEATFLIKLEYDMVSQPQATINVGPSLEEEFMMLCSYFTINIQKPVGLTLQNLTIQPQARRNV